MTSASPNRLKRSDGESIAYHKTAGKTPGVIFCGGFMSDMTGSKATALEDHCTKRGQSFLRFDYLGHGESSGDFAGKGCISRWADDAAAVLTELTEGPQIVVGSSMGGWVSLKLAISHPERVRGLVGIAPAPDFTTWMWEGLSSGQQDEVTTHGFVRIPSDYDLAGYVITRLLVDDGTSNFVLTDEPIPLDIPVRLLHGMADPDVPWQHSLKIAEHLASNDVRVSFSKSGDHRLSEPDDLTLLCATIDELTARISE